MYFKNGKGEWVDQNGKVVPQSEVATIMTRYTKRPHGAGVVRNDRDVYDGEQEKWKLMEQHRPELIEQLDRLFEIKDAIAVAGLDYALRGANLPSISRGKSFEQYMVDLSEKDMTMLLNEIYMSNKQRWSHAKDVLPIETIEYLREMFMIIEQLKKVGINYEAVANNESTRYLPVIGENEKEVYRSHTQLI